MTIVADWRSDGKAAVQADVYVGPARRPLPDRLAAAIVRAVVDQSVRLPDMFELVFDDRGLADELVTELAIGTEVGIAAPSPLRPGDPRMLMTGEVTALEAEYGETAYLTIRGYSQDHRLQRVRRSRTFVNMSDADIARKLARDAGLVAGEVTATRTVYEHVGQVNQTDWEFLSGRAAELGFDVGVAQGKFFFGRPAAGPPVPLRILSNLISFAPRVTIGNLAAEAEVRVWDPLAAKVVTGRAAVSSADGGYGTEVAEMVAKGNGKPLPAARSVASGDLGPPPSENALVVSDDPAATSATPGPAVQARADGLAGRLASTFAEAVGESIGDPWLAAGREVEVMGVAAPFAGCWMVTRARHELQYGKYRTRFEVSGGQDRSLLGLARGGDAAAGRIPGVVCGIVSNNLDPLGKSRVKVILPWLSPDYETGWASVVQAGAGERGGSMFLPETGDEVMVGFEFGDLQRPYVLGGIVNNRSTYGLGAPAVRAQGNSAAVQWRGLVAPSGSRLAFHDEVVGRNRVEQAQVLLGSGDGNLTLSIDQVAGIVTLKSVPGQLTRPGEKGRLVIECGPGGAIDIVAGKGGAITVDGGARLNLKAQQVNLEGQQVTVNGTGPTEIKGKPIKLN